MGVTKSSLGTSDFQYVCGEIKCRVTRG
jgi:hypothetical protein